MLFHFLITNLTTTYMRSKLTHEGRESFIETDMTFFAFALHLRFEYLIKFLHWWEIIF